MRDDFSSRIVKLLKERASYICSNPNCHKMTIAPSASSEEKVIYNGRAAHICAASPDGARYDPKMTSDERSSIKNGIFLCSGCADIIDDNLGLDFSRETLIQWKNEHEDWIRKSINKNIQEDGKGGDGGNGIIEGNRGVIITGKAGKGGNSGTGGKGGDGYIRGDDGLIICGDGGDAGTSDGRGGRGAKGPTERFGFSTSLWGYGRGGSGGNQPEYDRRIKLLKLIRQEYLKKFPNDATFIEAGIEQVPTDWINQSLDELSEKWSVIQGENGYILPKLK